MNKDFHYFGTYCASRLAGFSYEEGLRIASAALFVDLCTASFLDSVGGPYSAATTQQTFEMANARTDYVGLQDITRIWSSFHFLPRDLYAKRKGASKRYLNKFRLICGPNGDLVKETINLAKNGSLESIGIAMHVIADTWAHQNFAGTPSLVINNTTDDFVEILPDGTERKISFVHKAGAGEDIENARFINTMYSTSEKSVMNLGHGRAGHLPDYSYIKYRYLPAWGNYREIIKDNQSDYYHAFAQLVYAMRYLRGYIDEFDTDTYAFETVAPYEKDLKDIFAVRRTDDTEDWIKLANKITGYDIPDIHIRGFKEEYTNAAEADKEHTFLGAFFAGAQAHKSMVTNHIYKSNNPLAGVSIEVKDDLIDKMGIRDIYIKLGLNRENKDE
ncbi:MAG: hypothetical protein K6F99_10775 [Lachnospiraceae bacterium]|nr:hypothetical protein [Lachnospiraceae bacterium]